MQICIDSQTFCRLMYFVTESSGITGWLQRKCPFKIGLRLFTVIRSHMTKKSVFGQAERIPGVTIIFSLKKCLGLRPRSDFKVFLSRRRDQILENHVKLFFSDWSIFFQSLLTSTRRTWRLFLTSCPYFWTRKPIPNLNSFKSSHITISYAAKIFTNLLLL